MKSRLGIFVLVPLFFLGLVGCEPLSSVPAPLRFLKPSLQKLGLLKVSVNAPVSADVAALELVTEMVRVVLERNPAEYSDPRETEAFMGSVQSMIQGASLEGLYNGFIHSSSYRRLEVAYPGATPEALDVFADELAYLELEFPEPAVFGDAAAKPLIVLSAAELESSGAADKGADKEAVSTRESRRIFATLKAEYKKVFSKASVFTMKRVLGDEALRVISEKRKVPGGLVAWYPRWAARLALRKVDFGIPSRNELSEEFHHAWVTHVSDDQLSWEVLNRLHRLMGGAQKKVQKV
ncbi:hypothetical protein WDW86_16960 [Bdellovibrionota bacterium FG-2]